MSTDSDKQERSRLQHEAEHERPHKRSSVLLYLVILFAAAFLLLLMSYFMQQRANQEAMDKLEQTSDSATTHKFSSFRMECASLQRDSSAGIGVDSPYKMQFAINERGALFVLWAAFCAGVAKLFGKRGVFYEMVGQEVSGLDGFYDHEFQEYGEFGIRIPENPGKVCDEIEAATGVQAMIVDANDLNVEILGKASSVTLDDETLKGLIRDNPAGQSRELTPFILIREVKEERAPEEAQA